MIDLLNEAAPMAARRSMIGFYVQRFQDNALIYKHLARQLHIKTYRDKYSKCTAAHLVYLGR
jgi:hypothetical protein